jgi:hypothetical protein
MKEPRTCYKCSTTTLPSFFREDPDHNLQLWCRDCRRAALKLKAKKVRPKQLETMRKHNWDKSGILNLEGKPFTQDDYDKNFQLQNGLCKICKKPQAAFARALAADHNHTTGVFRGLLCNNCNTSIGLLNDNPNVAASLASYLLNSK